MFYKSYKTHKKYKRLHKCKRRALVFIVIEFNPLTRRLFNNPGTDKFKRIILNTYHSNRSSVCYADSQLPKNIVRTFDNLVLNEIFECPICCENFSDELDVKMTYCITCDYPCCKKM
jgi:hypothetical protein